MKGVNYHNKQYGLYEHEGELRWLLWQNVFDLGEQGAWDIWTPCYLDASLCVGTVRSTCSEVILGGRTSGSRVSTWLDDKRGS